MADQPENKFRQEYEKQRADHKAAVQEAVAALISGYKTDGLLKPCPSCGRSFWQGRILYLQGQNLEDYLPSMFNFASVVGVATTALQCLALTCCSCGHLLFYDTEMLDKLAKALRDLKAAEQAAQGKQDE